MGFSAQKHAYYEKHVEAWRHSGLSQKKYCEQANIGPPLRFVLPGATLTNFRLETYQ
jgi:hypothetical protein